MYTVRLKVIQGVSSFDQAFRNNIFINASTSISHDCVVENGQLCFKTIGAAQQTGVIHVELELISVGIGF